MNRIATGVRLAAAGRRLAPWLLGACLVAPLPGLPLPSAAAQSLTSPRGGTAGLGPRAAKIEARKRDHFERMVEGFSVEGTTVTAWTAAGRIEKIEVEALGDRGRLLLDFYWQGTSLVAARERRIDYGQAITALPKDAPTPMTVVKDEGIEFSSSGHVAHWRLDGRAPPVQGRAATARGRELTAQARSFRRLMAASAPPRAPDCEWGCAGGWHEGSCERFSCR